MTKRDINQFKRLSAFPFHCITSPVKRAESACNNLTRALSTMKDLMVSCIVVDLVMSLVFHFVK